MKQINRQRNHKRNGDNLYQTGVNLNEDYTIVYETFIETASADNWYYNETTGVLYYVEGNEEDLVINGNTVTVYYTPYTYITIDSTPENLIRNYPDDGISVGSAPLFQIDDISGNFIINDNRI